VISQPAMLTCERAAMSTSAMRGNAVAPSISRSKELPGRGGGSASAHKPGPGDKDRSQPKFRKRRS